MPNDEMPAGGPDPIWLRTDPRYSDAELRRRDALQLATSVLYGRPVDELLAGAELIRAWIEGGAIGRAPQPSWRAPTARDAAPSPPL